MILLDIYYKTNKALFLSTMSLKRSSLTLNEKAVLGDFARTVDTCDITEIGEFIKIRPLTYVIYPFMTSNTS